MRDLVVQLLPEMVGLVITPGAVVACLLLLDSARPVRNVAVFAGAFMTLYVVVCVAVLLAGSPASGSSDASEVRAWVGVVVGSLFLLGAATSVVLGSRRRRAEVGASPTPGWVDRLQHPDTRTVLVAGVALSALNPNLAILVSGLTTVVAAGVPPSEQAVGAVLLLGACLLDFLVPAGIYLLLGAPARDGLDRARSWLVRHDATIGVVVLVVFGVLFLGRGLAAM